MEGQQNPQNFNEESQPQQPQSQEWQQEQQPQQGESKDWYHPGQKQWQKPEFLKRFTSNDWLAKMVFVGILLLMIGMIFSHMAPFMTNYGSNAPDSDDQLDDRATENTIKYLGNIIEDVGIFLVSVFFILAAIYRQNMKDKFRLMLLIFSLSVLIFTWFGGIL